MPDVYVFNQMGSTIQAFAPNGFTAGVISNWGGPDTEAPYTPAQLIVPLVDASEDEALKHGKFAYGKNHVLYRTARTYDFNVEFPKPKKEKDGTEYDPSWLLYLTVDQWFLYDADGRKPGKLRKQGDIKKQKAAGDSEEEEEAAEAA